MNLCKSLCVSLCLMIFFVSLADVSYAQERSRVVQPSQPTQPKTENRRPPLTDRLIVRQQEQQKKQNQPLVKNTASSRSTTNSNAANLFATSSVAIQKKMIISIQSKYGLRYVYGSTGPNTYDCSGFVWSVFNDAGISFDRSSARTYWSQFEPVSGDDRYKFGTLVFFNKLGHIGIVANENGFYHASSSKGITFSKFEGYWEERIVGFRRVPIEYLTGQ